jgi:trk system potassium uptake protein TrkH
MIHVPGVMALFTLPVCFGAGESYAIWPFLVTALLSLALGQLLYRSFLTAEDARLHHGMMVAALGWLIVPAIGSIPFFGVAHYLSHSTEAAPTVQAFLQTSNFIFEAFSGFTGTGLTMAVHPADLPRSLQWWRSFTEWIGGGGVILLMLSILSHRASAYSLYHSEGRSKKIRPSVVSTVRTIWWIYLSFTLVSVALLRIVGMSWWEALNHGMTGISTGGFSVTDGSIGDYGAGVKWAVILIMILGTISFAVHYRILSKRQWSALWGDAQHRMLWLLLGGGALLLLMENVWWSGTFIGVDSVFQWVSALGTAGFQTVDLRLMSPTGQLLLSLAMILGGAAGSTAGGLKQVRVALLHQGLLWRFRRIRQQPHQLTHYEFDGEPLEESEATKIVQNAGILAALWAVVLWSAVLVLIHVVPEEFSLSEVILEVSSAQGNVGLSTGITHPSLPWLGKLVLIVCMWMGRLEIIPTLILLSALLGYLRRPFQSGGPGRSNRAPKREKEKDNDRGGAEDAAKHSSDSESLK